MTEPLDIDSDGQLDVTPLKFGQYKGKTPEFIVDTYMKRGEQYLRWAYETVGNFPVCSAAMYRDIGGRGTRAVGSVKKTPQQQQVTGKDKAGNQGEQEKEDKPLHGSRPKPTYFDDYDDDFPF